MAALLNVSGLTVVARDDERTVPIVKNIDLSVPANAIVGLVGESGSGKSTTGMSILGLLAPGLRLIDGRIEFDGKNLIGMKDESYRRIRGKDIGMVFQEPLNAFNPVLTIGDQIGEVLIYHTNLTKEQRGKRVFELLEQAGLSDPVRVAANYPHQLSGGMRQRAMIAQAIAGQPKLIIADEPTSNLDVTLQARIIELFEKLRKDLSLSILLITHDLGMVEHMADEISVMKNGEIVESGPAKSVIQNPQNPYTQKLMEASIR